MNWGIEDVAAAAAILVAVVAGLAIVLKTIRKQPARTLAAAGVVVLALAIWAHLAVGIWN